MQNLLQDFRYALRMMRKNAGLSFLIVLSLGIGVGANSAIFSVVDALLLRPLPYPQPDRLAAIWLHAPGIGISLDWPSPGQYYDVKTQSHSFEETAISQLSDMTLTGLDQPQLVGAMQTSTSLFHMLGAKPMMGRLLLPEEDRPGRPKVAVLSHGVWRRLFNSDPGIVGRSITLNGESYAVVGILSQEFTINSEVMIAEGPMDHLDVFLPLPIGPEEEHDLRHEDYNITVRLKPGVSLARAQADVDMIADRIRVRDKRDQTFGMGVVGLQNQVVGGVRRALLVLLGSVGLVLLIACANVANLLLTRAAAREKEIAVRTALGASRLRLVRQLLTESVLLSALGGAAGLVIAQWSLAAVHSMNPGNIPRLDDIQINATVLLFTFGISLATGILFGLAPVWRALMIDLNSSLKSGGRSGQSHGGMDLRRNRLRGLLVVAELALSLMLLVGAGLLIRSFIRLQAVPPGFSTDHILSMRVLARGPEYQQKGAVVQLFREIDDRVARLPGVKSCGLNLTLPLASFLAWSHIEVEGYQPPPNQELQVDFRGATPGYFQTMGIPLVEGRFFTDHDNADSQQVVIVGEDFARRFWPHESAIGKHVWRDPKKPLTVVGVVGVVKQYGLDSGSKIAVYFPHRQLPFSSMYLVARSTSDPEALTGEITREIHAFAPNVVIYDVHTMQERLHSSLARQRFATTMLGAFAAFALLLASVGIYGVMSYLVAQGTHDIGVRVALGAQPGNILRLVVGQGMQMAALGIAAGLLAALALTRVMSSMLFGVSSTDAVTFSSVAVILALVALAATIIPARRAIRVDPIVALRDE